MGRSYNKLGKDKEAESAFRKAVNLKPKNSEYQTELGAILIKFAKYNQAISVLNKAIKLDESNSRAEDLLVKAKSGRRRVNFGKDKSKKQNK